ncbi:hypothetical protein ACJMK2_033811 [Sinanodonta woodiana]|uniref:Vertnin n=1 Tax=Sinanodonta woodiana TaxID=1069815 RepID=A0ABD3WRE0_SINWO
MGPKRAKKYPCGSCSSACAFECVYCITCANWYHRQCQSMSDEELRQWGELDLDYVCISCRSLNGSRFDFVSALQRLGMAARSKDLDKLTAAIDRELLFKPRLSIPVKQHKDFPSADSIASYIMANYVDDVYGNPITTTGDGNCLYNAISILLFGNEALATQLRYLTCIQLVTNMTTYMNHPISNELYLVSSDYDKACFDAGTCGAFSNAWHLLALSDVIMRPIRSIYPNVNGDKDGARIYLNKIFYPSNPLESASPLTVLWYSIGKMPEPNVYYNVNHFAAVTDVIERGINTKRQQSTKRKISSSGSSACESDCYHEDDAADDDNNYDDEATQSRKQLPLKVRQLSFNGSEDGNNTYCYDADGDDGVADDEVKEYADKYIHTLDSVISSHNAPVFSGFGHDLGGFGQVLGRFWVVLGRFWVVLGKSCCRCIMYIK